MVELWTGYADKEKQEQGRKRMTVAQIWKMDETRRRFTAIYKVTYGDYWKEIKNRAGIRIDWRYGRPKMAVHEKQGLFLYEEIYTNWTQHRAEARVWTTSLGKRRAEAAGGWREREKRKFLGRSRWRGVIGWRWVMSGSDENRGGRLEQRGARLDARGSIDEPVRLLCVGGVIFDTWNPNKTNTTKKREGGREGERKLRREEEGKNGRFWKEMECTL